MTLLRVTLHLDGEPEPSYIQSDSIEWGKYPVAGRPLVFGSGPWQGIWMVYKTKMLFGAVENIELWATKLQ